MHFAESDFLERETLFVEIVLPLSLAINYTYRVPYELNEAVAVGKRVVVQFGKHKIYTALVKSIGKNPPAHYQAKYIIDVIDDYPLVNEKQFKFWNWITSYYLCNEGDVMSAALPTGLKLASETVLLLREELPEELDLSDKEQLIFEVLHKQHRISIDEVASLLGQKTVYPIVNSLIAKEIIVAAEEVVDKYKPLLKSFVKLNDFYHDDVNLKALFEQLEKAPKQLDALLAYLKLSKGKGFVSKNQLIEESGSGQAALKALADKGVFYTEKRPVSRLSSDGELFDINFELSDHQKGALAKVKEQFETKDVVLLHGVTAAGKTQLYIKLIEEAIANGGQVLFLLPEIALTTQIVERIKLYFGSKIGVYHSKFNDNERVEIWNKVLSGAYQVVLGARSAVLLPFSDLKLVVVDEEHENSYKQYDPAPRYQARDAAIYLA
ncbi:primosomal protein N' family DNA-binding protein, partial [Pedobacter sp.]